MSIRELVKAILKKSRISRLKWHDFRNTRPVSKIFGLDRGTPIDRFYIENFLRDNRHFIRGKVLEIADNKYAKKFGNDILSFEILHVESSDKVTIVGDLTRPSTLPHDTIDCFICTQVFNFIFDFQHAIEGAFQVLKPGGTVLATVSGISQISRYDADRWGHFWSFYPQGIGGAFKKVFGEDNVEVRSFGNSLSAACFIKGLATEELTAEELHFQDPDYPVTITIIARKK